MTRLHPHPAPASPAQLSPFSAIIINNNMLRLNETAGKGGLRYPLKETSTQLAAGSSGEHQRAWRGGGARTTCEGGGFVAGAVAGRQGKGSITKWFRNTISGWESRGKGTVKKYRVARERGHENLVLEMAQKLLSGAGRAAAEGKKASDGHDRNFFNHTQLGRNKQGHYMLMG